MAAVTLGGTFTPDELRSLAERLGVPEAAPHALSLYGRLGPDDIDVVSGLEPDLVGETLAHRVLLRVVDPGDWRPTSPGSHRTAPNRCSRC